MKTEQQFDLKEYKTPIKRWSLEQNIKYSQFLLKHMDKMESPEEMRRFKFFSKMSKTAFRSKTACQCKSHHQKMIQTYGNVQRIIATFLPNQTSEVTVPTQQNQNLSKQSNFIPQSNREGELQEQYFSQQLRDFQKFRRTPQDKVDSQLIGNADNDIKLL